MGRKHFRFIQLGQESVAGTAVAATAIWRGNGVLSDDREVVFVNEDIGNLGGSDRTYIPKLGGSISFDETPASFEHLPYIFSAGIVDVTAGTADGGGTDYIYEYSMNTTSENSVQTYTIEGGDDQQAEEMEYCFVNQFSLSGNGGEAVMVSADWMGRQVANTTKTAALSLETIESVLFNKGKLYIDAATASIGSTQITGSLLGFQLDCMTGWNTKETADGNLYFNFIYQAPPELTCQLTFEHDSNAVAEKTNWRNEAALNIRLLFEGSAFGTPGTTYSNHTLQIDMAGKWENIDPIGETNGNDILTGTFRAKWVEDASLFAVFTVANEVASLT